MTDERAVRTPAVQVAPDMAFGAPAMRGISTEVIAGHYWLDEDVETDYELSRHELLVVLWFEATHGRPRFRRRWKVWAVQVEGALWSSSSLDPDAVELPSAVSTYQS